MEAIAFTDTFVFAYIILPLIIFLSKILDQTIGSIRIIFVSKSMKYLAPMLAFFEVLLWLIIMKQIVQNLNNYYYYLAYAGGFAMGNFVGIKIEAKMAMGLVQMRVIPQKDSSKLVGFLRNAGYRFTTIKGHGAEGQVEIIFSVIKRKSIEDFVSIIKEFNPKAFYTIEEIKFVSDTAPGGQFYNQDFTHMKRLFKQTRKGK
ncbi:MAG: DUF2179 domain-containing protein [Candidatus Cloacimonetes bacterium]|nr:DUF2179 domain-containing protein [Candidatus Cloacimonadota bacterium]